MRSSCHESLLRGGKLLLLLVCWALCPSGLCAQTMAIPYAEPTPAVDGVGPDWNDRRTVEYRQKNPIASNANLLKVQLAWDEQYLYLYAEVTDNLLLKITNDSSLLYLNDALELYIDPLDDSGNRMDINDYQFIVDYMGSTAVLKGDKSLIVDSTVVAPKDYGIATVTYRHATRILRDEEDGVVGYAVEIAVPFSGLGAVPKLGMQLKMDVCIDDLDSLVDLKTIPDGGHLPGYFASNWDGDRDFSFPDHWRLFRLEGGPSTATKLSRDLLPYWIYIVVGLVLLAALIIGIQAYRISQLKDVLPRKNLSPALMQALAEIPPYSTLVSYTTESDQTLELEPSEGNSPPVAVPSQSQNEFAEQSTAQSTTSSLHPQIARCRQYILDHLDQELRMEDLASECATSLRSLQRIFKDELSMSPGNFVVLIKMEHAAELLRSRACNVSEAAWQLGFQDSSYFSRVFKKYHGISPRELLE